MSKSYGRNSQMDLSKIAKHSRVKDKVGFNGVYMIWCPGCKQYKRGRIGPRQTDDLIQNEFSHATDDDREQLTSGICGARCWNKITGI